MRDPGPENQCSIPSSSTAPSPPNSPILTPRAALDLLSYYASGDGPSGGFLLDLVTDWLPAPDPEAVRRGRGLADRYQAEVGEPRTREWIEKRRAEIESARAVATTDEVAIGFGPHWIPGPPAPWSPSESVGPGANTTDPPESSGGPLPVP